MNEYPLDNTLPGDDLADLAREFRSVWQLLVRCTPPASGDGHLQPQQYWVLAELRRSGRRSMSSLAECSHVSQASLTGIVDRLGDRGLIERVRSDEDRRVVEVSVTDAGVAELQRSRAQMLERLETLLNPLSPMQRTELLSLLREVTRHHDPKHAQPDEEEAR